jgi:hypothetical protein
MLLEFLFLTVLWVFFRSLDSVDFVESVGPLDSLDSFTSLAFRYLFVYEFRIHGFRARLILSHVLTQYRTNRQVRWRLYFRRRKYFYNQRRTMARASKLILFQNLVKNNSILSSLVCWDISQIEMNILIWKEELFQI